MKTPTMLAQLCAVAVLGAPLALFGGANDETIRALKLREFVEPEFPTNLLLEGVAGGEATLVIGRDAAGIPVDVLVVEATHQKIAEAAVAAVRHWRFAPADSARDASAVLVTVGFRTEGVVFVYPFSIDLTRKRSSEAAPTTIPSLQTLEPPPKALSQPMPEYPAALMGQGVEGKVEVKFYVDQDGHVRIPQVIESTTPEFSAAALAAIAQWRYEPPRVGAHRIVASDYWTFRFGAAN